MRVIAATNKNLIQEIKNGNFREDLYYRLNVIPFEVPPLRERIEDIPILVDHFNNEFSNQNGKKAKYFTDSAMKKLCEYSWPGNIRELKNVIEHIIIMTLSDKITSRDMPSNLWVASNVVGSNISDDFFSLDFKSARDRFEREYIIKKLKEFNGNISKTAENISVERSHLHKKMKQYDITN